MAGKSACLCRNFRSAALSSADDDQSALCKETKLASRRYGKRPVSRYFSEQSDGPEYVSVISCSVVTKRPSADIAIESARSFPIGSLEGRADNQNSTELSIKMLQKATREAGAFQRSALGHIEHRDWLDRVLADGQRLTDLLRDMGFISTESS